MVVCTLCSCYPWVVLGLPPTWYKSFAYRSRAVIEPRAVLREFGLELDEEVTVHVHDSSAEVRYMVLPERPPGTEGLTEEELAALVTRDAMIGVAKVGGAVHHLAGVAPGLARDGATMSDRRIEDLGDDLAVPRKNGELVFEAPWEGRVFGMAVVLSDDQVYAWDDFRDHLVAEIAAAEEHGDASGYYERWLASFERLLLDSGVVTADELDTRTAEYAAGVYDEHEHYETTSDAIASLTRSPHTSAVRNIVWRADGEPINVFRRPGQLFVCATGCCCGHTERGHAPVPEELYHREWARRRIRHKVHLSLGGCLGPCALSNVALLLFAGHQIWFHSIVGDEQVVAIYDYIEAMVRADRYLPPPPALAPQVFDVFDWSEPASEQRTAELPDREEIAAGLQGH